MPKGFYTLLVAQFFSALADLALLIVAIAQLTQSGSQAFEIPLLKLVFGGWLISNSFEQVWGLIFWPDIQHAIWVGPYCVVGLFYLVSVLMTWWLPQAPKQALKAH